MLDIKWQVRTSLFFDLGLGMEAPQPATDRWGRDPESFPRDGEVRLNVEGEDAYGDTTVI